MLRLGEIKCFLIMACLCLVCLALSRSSTLAMLCPLSVNARRCYALADVISIFVYEVPCIFWRYISVDEVSLITLKKLLQSAMELLQIATVHQPVWDRPNFWTVLTCCFYGLERRFFFFLEYLETQL